MCVCVCSVKNESRVYLYLRAESLEVQQPLSYMACIVCCPHTKHTVLSIIFTVYSHCEFGVCHLSLLLKFVTDLQGHGDKPCKTGIIQLS